MKDYLEYIAPIAVCILFVVGYFLIYKHIEARGQLDCVTRYGSDYEYRYQHYSTDVCVNPDTGEMRYL